MSDPLEAKATKAENNADQVTTQNKTGNDPPSTNNTPNNTATKKPLKVIFLHLDLGIGGAEQLVLQLASASHALGHEVTLLTTRCDPDHCFQLVKPPDGALYHCLTVQGRWIPPNILGVGTALCSTLRVLYLALWLCWSPPSGGADLVVLDVLPTPLWLLQRWTSFSLLFYCHFPDKLLIRNMTLNTNQDKDEATATTTTTTTTPKKSIYRKIMDGIEEACMPLADSILVNSKFTKRVVLQEFTSLKETDLQVLYPALDTKAIDAKPNNNDDNSLDVKTEDSSSPITLVSLNRYERKKKIELILYAYALMRDKHPPGSMQVIIAGGYDTQNMENVEYRGELEQIAIEELHLPRSEVQFQTSISDAQRTYLLKSARCVVYTPQNEHFGIVPLEVMYAGTPVVACNSGGPLETVIHGTTGFLCPPVADDFAKALHILVSDATLAQKMGQAGRQHVRDKFGIDHLEQEWNKLTQQAYWRGQQRIRQRPFQAQPWLLRLIVYLVEALLAFLLCLALTHALRHVGILESHESILGSMRRRWQSDEL